MLGHDVTRVGLKHLRSGKVRDLYEVPAASIILTAHKELEKLVGHEELFDEVSEIPIALQLIQTGRDGPAAALATVGLPAVIRPSFTLGGTGGGIAYNRDEFEAIIQAKLADEKVYVQMSLDRSQASGVHEKQILAQWNNDAFGNGKDHFFGWATTKSDGSVYVGWYDNRNDSFDTKVEYFVGKSTNGGNTFPTQQAVSTILARQIIDFLKSGAVAGCVNLPPLTAEAARVGRGGVELVAGRVVGKPGGSDEPAGDGAEQRQEGQLCTHRSVLPDKAAGHSLNPGAATAAAPRASASGTPSAEGSSVSVAAAARKIVSTPSAPAVNAPAQSVSARSAARERGELKK